MTATPLASDVSARITDRVAQAVGPRRFAMWFDRSARLDYRPGQRVLRVSVPNRFVADRVQKYFAQDLADAAREAVGEAVSVDLRVDAGGFTDTDTRLDPSAPAPRATPAAGSCGAGPGGARVAADLGRAAGGFALRYRLEDFVVGPSNELAFASASRLAEGDSDFAHPLFIHGGCGLGKTHLLQGVCRAALDRDPGSRVVYTTGERFTNEYISAVRGNGLDAFRRRVRSLDLLALDDVHFFANKNATQQEFLHCFEAMDLAGAKIVLASDSHPKQIQAFSEALVSRCVRGMVVSVQTPDAQTRRRLITALAERRGLLLEPAAGDAFAARVQGSVREIEGKLAKLHAMAWLEGRRSGRQPEAVAVGGAMVQRLFEAEAVPQPRRIVRFDELLAASCDLLAVTPEQVRGGSRQRSIVLARSLLIYLAREHIAMSYPEIATALGKKTHSTIITAAQRFRRQLDENQAMILPGLGEPTTPSDLVARVRRTLGLPTP